MLLYMTMFKGALEVEYIGDEYRVCVPVVWHTFFEVRYSTSSRTMP